MNQTNTITAPQTAKEISDMLKTPGRNVYVPDNKNLENNRRIINVRTHKGQVQVKELYSGRWRTLEADTFCFVA